MSVLPSKAGSEPGSEPSGVESPRKLGLGAKLAYGAGDLGTGMTANLVAFSFLVFLTTVAGLPPGLAGSVVMVGKGWDAINDPVVGLLSDRTRSRWGRRHAWMIYGAVPFGLSVVLLWLSPNFGNVWLTFGYYVLASVLFHTAYTVVNLPYAALTAELTQDYDERTALTSFRLAFSLVGAVSGLVLGLILSNLLPQNVSLQYQLLGILAAVIAVGFLAWCIGGTLPAARERGLLERQPLDLGLSQPDQSSGSLRSEMLSALSNRAYQCVIGIYLFSWLALQITASIIPFFAVSWMRLGSYFQVALIVQGSAIGMLFVCNALSRVWGKRKLYFIGIGSWILVQGGLFFLQPGQTGLLYILCFAASFGVATTYLVPWSMLPDVVELDQLQTGRRREGVFYSFMTLLQKLGLALGLFLVGIALEWAGFVESTPGGEIPIQPESALLAIRIAIGPLPTIALMASLVLAWLYPITRQKHADIRAQLQARHPGSQARLPRAGS